MHCPVNVKFEILAVEPLVPARSVFEFEVAVGKSKRFRSNSALVIQAQQTTVRTEVSIKVFCLA
jgi:hypothetical protein